MTTPIPATLIPGDGIGPEIVDATLAALDALQAPFEWDHQIAGLGGVKAAGDPLPQATLESIRRTRLALKGPLETPSGGGYRSSNVRLREEFTLYANMRPARTIIPGGRFDNIDLMVVRENLEGLYIGHEHYVPIDGDPHAVAMATGINTRQGCIRILEYAFQTAVRTGRKKVTLVHKANIMKALTGIFLETGQELYARKYKGQFELDSVIIDACAMKMVINPWQFDMLVTTNLFGDILSDLAAGLVGGLGMAPGANIGADAAIFEAVHGSAPDIAGKGIANPTALLLAAALMLDHCKLKPLGDRLRKAIDDTLNVDQVRTGDLGGKANTEAFTKALVSRIKGALMAGTLPALSLLETRVLGVLVEKQRTVPDSYPLTLNTLVAGCNQKTSRNPVLEVSDAQAQAALDSLKGYSLVTESSGGRTYRYEHNAARVLQLPSQSVILLAVLMLRGPQTAGELRIACDRMHNFADISAVEGFLNEMAERPAGALVTRLARLPGARESRWAHLLSGEVAGEAAAATGAASADAGGDITLGEVSALKANVARLEAEVGELRGLLARVCTELGIDAAG